MTQCYLRQILLFNTRIKLGRCSVVQSRCGQNIVKPHTYMPRLLKTRYTVVWYKCAQNSSSWQFHTIFHLPLCHFRLLGPWYLLSTDQEHLRESKSQNPTTPDIWQRCAEVLSKPSTLPGPLSPLHRSLLWPWFLPCHLLPCQGPWCPHSLALDTATVRGILIDVLNVL